MNKKSKRIAAFLLLVMAIMMLAGCKKQTDASESPEEQESDVSKYVTLGEYLGVQAEKIDLGEVTPEVMELNVKQMLYSYAEYEQVERPAQEGDRAIVSYQGYMDGEPFEGGSASGDEMIIGLGSFIPGFEEGVIGMKVGETKRVDVVFPEDYWSRDFAGKEAYFDITLEEVYDAELPEYTDEFVAENLSYSTIEEYEAAMKEGLQAQLEAEEKSQQLQAVWEAIREGCTFHTYPEEEIEAYVADYVDYYTYMAQYSGESLDSYLKANYGLTEERFRETVYEWAYQEIGDTLIVKAIIQAEGMALDDEEYAKEKSALMQSQGYSSEEAFENAYGATFEEYYGKDNITQAVLQNRVYDLVMSNAALR